MKALLVERALHRFAAARVGAALGGTGAALGLGPLRLVDTEAPSPQGDGWRRIRPRLSGICGSDLHTVDGASSRYFEGIVSFPFVLGHEIVADVLDGPLAGRRAVVEPVLGCAARGIEPMCRACAEGRKGACDRLAFGHLAPGLQTGFCKDTGGGWSEELIAHDSQLHAVPEEMSDEDAVVIEPTACALHAALQAGVVPGETVVVLGAGTIGLLTLAALRAHSLPGTLIAIAKHPVQRAFAEDFGADVVARPDALARAVRRATGALALEDSSGAIARLAGGTDVVLDCVGTSSSLTAALGVVRPGGRIVCAGMPATVKVDLAPLWQREITLLGAYAYGREDVGEDEEGPGSSTFALATALVQRAGLGRIVSARYALDHFEEALRHAGAAGRRGAVKVVFDLRPREKAWRARSGTGADVAGGDGGPASAPAPLNTKETR